MTYLAHDPTPYSYGYNAKPVLTATGKVMMDRENARVEDCPEEYTRMKGLVYDIVTDQPTSWIELQRIIQDSVTPAPCHCEHDCCGHWHGWVLNPHLTPTGAVEFEISLSRNY